jgi:hypothetical protein
METANDAHHPMYADFLKLLNDEQDDDSKSSNTSSQTDVVEDEEIPVQVI